MRILLVQPDYLIEGFGFRLVAMPEPLHLEILAAAIGDHDIRILDMRIDTDLARALAEFQPEMVGVTALTTEVYAAQKVLAEVKAFSPDIFTVIGGHHCTLMPDDFMISQVDAIALGEGEFVLGLLIDAISGKSKLSSVPSLIWQDKNGEFIANTRSEIDRGSMDVLPLPRRDLVSQYSDEYFFLFDKPDSSVATGRGCPYKCNFCSVHEFYGGVTKQMSAERVIAEIKAVNTSHITFVDDNFMMNNRRENKIADMIKSEGIDMTFSMVARTDTIARHPELVTKWVDVGLYAMLLGLEGATEASLASVNKSNKLSNNDESIKILKDNGVIIWGAFIADPQWTKDDFKRLSDYVNEKEIIIGGIYGIPHVYRFAPGAIASLFRVEHIISPHVIMTV